MFHIPNCIWELSETASWHGLTNLYYGINTQCLEQTTYFQALSGKQFAGCNLCKCTYSLFPLHSLQFFHCKRTISTSPLAFRFRRTLWFFQHGKHRSWWTSQLTCQKEHQNYGFSSKFIWICPYDSLQ